jgi:hypothetical protein
MPNANTLACVALIVRDPFDCYKRGDCIRDAALIQKILDSNQARHVNKISVPAVPAAQVTPTEEPSEQPIKAAPKTSKKPKE